MFPSMQKIAVIAVRHLQKALQKCGLLTKQKIVWQAFTIHLIRPIEAPAVSALESLKCAKKRKKNRPKQKLRERKKSLHQKLMPRRVASLVPFSCSRLEAGFLPSPGCFFSSPTMEKCSSNGKANIGRSTFLFPLFFSSRDGRNLRSRKANLSKSSNSNFVQ